MTPQERDVIAGIFDRLRHAADQPRDPEAERFIAQKLQEQPYAPYAMAQAVYVQEQALTNLQAQVEQLQAQVEEMRKAPQPEPAPQSGGFLAGIFGGGQPQRSGSVPSFPQRAAQAQPSGNWNTQRPQQAEQPAAPAGPWGGQAAQQAAAGRGGGFMATALTTAAGVAGGMMLGNILTNAFGSKPGEQAAATPAADDAKTADAGTADSQSSTASGDSGQDYQPATYEDPHPYDDGMDDSFADDGGDWA
jgi:hypothetical protein